MGLVQPWRVMQRRQSRGRPGVDKDVGAAAASSCPRASKRGPPGYLPSWLLTRTTPPSRPHRPGYHEGGRRVSVRGVQRSAIRLTPLLSRWVDAGFTPTGRAPRLRRSRDLKVGRKAGGFVRKSSQPLSNGEVVSVAFAQVRPQNRRKGVKRRQTLSALRVYPRGHRLKSLSDLPTSPCSISARSGRGQLRYGRSLHDCGPGPLPCAVKAPRVPVRRRCG